MKKVNNILWGIVLIAIGALFALNALNITNIDIFFDGEETVQLDGEPLYTNHVCFRMEPHAVKLIVPEGMKFFA